jgi:tRNA(adenine34) deaminase
VGLTAEPNDERAMRLALEEARTCLEHGDVAIGAVVTRGDDVLAAVGNRRELDGDPTAHAEILALRAASAALG